MIRRDSRGCGGVTESPRWDETSTKHVHVNVKCSPPCKCFMADGSTAKQKVGTEKEISDKKSKVILSVWINT